MVGGQCLDLQSDKLGEPLEPDTAYIRYMQGLKTGALLRFSCEAGAILANASETDRMAMRKFGEHLGAAFQLADDLLDVEGTPEAVGKATGKDEAAGKATLVGLLGVSQARIKLTEIRAAALDILSDYGPEADSLRQATDFVVMRKS